MGGGQQHHVGGRSEVGNVATAERWNLTETDCYLHTVALPAEPSLHACTYA